jgi:nucleoside-diphosphate-sugar epimerase
MNLFITGVTGYIGGTVALRLMREGHVVRGLVRDAAQTQALRQLGIEPIVGALEDVALLTQEAQRADAVINAASSDHVVAVTTLLKALTGSGKIFIHTEGSGIVNDNAQGEWAAKQIYDESTPLTPLPDKAQRVELDQTVIQAVKQNVHSVVLVNSMVYGVGRGLNKTSVQLPMLIDHAEETGVARYIGKGSNSWSNVHIDDVADAYALALKKAPAGSLYYIENGAASMLDIACAIADKLDLGAPQSWSMDDASQAFGGGYAKSLFGSNSRVSAQRARTELGWTPQHHSILEWIKLNAD